MCKAHGSQHGLPQGATPLVQRHLLLRLRCRQVTYPYMHVAHPCGNPGTVRYLASDSHLQIRQQHHLFSYCTSSHPRPSQAQHVGFSNCSTRPAHMSTPNTWTCDGRVLYSPGPASPLPSAALRSGRSSLSHCTYPRSGPPRAPVTRRKFTYSASPTLMALPLPFSGRLSWHLSGLRHSQARR